jgi:hypothetical protein
MRDVGDLVRHHRAADAATLRPARHAGLDEEAVDDQLTAPLEQVEQAADDAPGPGSAASAQAATRPPRKG